MTAQKNNDTASTSTNKTSCSLVHDGKEEQQTDR